MAGPENEAGAVEAQMPPSLIANVRLLKAVVIGLGVVLVLAVIGLIAAAVLRAGKAPAASALNGAEPYTVTLKGDGVHIAAASIDGGRLIVHLTTRQGEQLVIFDAATGKQLGRVSVLPTPPSAP